MKILVVEDDPMIREAVVTILTEDGYIVDEAQNGDEGLYYAEQEIYDLLILDIMLPGKNGLDVIRQVRNKGIEVPIVILTARDSLADRVAGLDCGADDYIVKPFALPELLARVRALLRRHGRMGKEQEINYGNLSVNLKLKEGFIDSTSLQLTIKEYELLEFLLLNKEQILTREQIFERIWGLSSETTLGIVDLYIHYVRKKLAPYDRDSWIRTVRGAGFMLKETK